MVRERVSRSRSSHGETGDSGNGVSGRGVQRQPPPCCVDQAGRRVARYDHSGTGNDCRDDAGDSLTNYGEARW